MASLTVRQLDERIKKRLRLRAARNGRSVEDEVRTILRAAGEESGAEAPQPISPPAPQTGRRAEATPAHDVKRVLLIVGGGIAAYKSLDLIRRLKERGIAVRCILTKAAEHFVTPLSAGAIVGERVFTDLFDPAGEFDIGHIRLAREADLIVVAPATADLMAKMAGGHADDLATAVLLATTAKILLAPAMKLGRMAEPLEIAAAVERLLSASTQQTLAGRRVLITSGPTHEPIDPVRYIANRSSGKQGHAIAAAASAAGADVVLVSGPVNLPDPPGVTIVHVETARDMLRAAERALPADVAIFAAAVADWRVANAGAQKIKKKAGQTTPDLSLVENPDILATIAHRKSQRPKLVIGFAAETENVAANAKEKLARKGCDWILANDVSPQTGIMGGNRNTIQLVTPAGIEPWPPQSKDDVAAMLIARIADELDGDKA
ncbi:MAG: bifunctional phosphopantothenoylcysteine decarboxylase/phosphopantothenate synthase [Rhizobiales bacterium]|nr:bifunctional phosphopantothenoylcysteine decarboxylase/phosphopantothenate synthase [Hyphomicrobiales bacterium]